MTRVTEDDRMAYDEGLAERLRERLDDPAVTAKKMFGALAFEDAPSTAKNAQPAAEPTRPDSRGLPDRGRLYAIDRRTERVRREGPITGKAAPRAWRKTPISR
jgi:hypothetical protein